MEDSGGVARCRKIRGACRGAFYGHKRGLFYESLIFSSES
jgi:hypothetical protein